MIDRLRRLPTPLLVVVTALVVASPLIVAAIALSQRRWYPVLDLAMTELRVRDVGGSQTPLIGLPGRIGETIPEQGSHPGPLSFWLLAPGYRAFGSSAWALEAATVVIAFVWMSVALWIGHRRLGVPGVAMVAAVIAIMVRGFGLSVLTQPWNPYMPLLAWLVVLLATWSVLCADDAMLLPLVAGASFAAQTHIPYLLMAGGLGLLAVGVVAVRWVRSRRSEDPGSRPPTAVLLTIGAFAVLWLAPLVDQVRRGENGNFSRLLDHFLSPPEEAIGFRAGIRLALRHLDITVVPRMLTGRDEFLAAGLESDGPFVPGLILLLVWIGAVLLAFRVGHMALLRLHAVLGVTLVLTVLSMSRIFGVRWFYLTLWAWITTTLVVVAVAWTAVAWLRDTRPDIGRAVTPSRLALGGGTLAAVATVAMLAVAPSTDHPEEYLSDPLGAVVGPTAAALDPNGSYVVQFRDASAFGSQAFGLVSELDRNGLDVGMEDFWTVPITESRTKSPGEFDAQVFLVTGDFIAEFRADSDFTELASDDPLDESEREEYEVLRTALVDELRRSGDDDLVELVDTNLFLLTIDQTISREAQRISAEMKLFGSRTAVFVGPPGAEQ